MRLAGPQEGEAIFFGVLKCALVRADDPGLEIFNPQRGKNTGAATWLAVRERKILCIAVEARLRVWLHNPLRPPGLKSLGRYRIGVFCLIEIEMDCIIGTLKM